MSGLPTKTSGSADDEIEVLGTKTSGLPTEPSDVPDANEGKFISCCSQFCDYTHNQTNMFFQTSTNPLDADDEIESLQTPTNPLDADDEIEVIENKQSESVDSQSHGGKHCCHSLFCLSLCVLPHSPINMYSGLPTESSSRATQKINKAAVVRQRNWRPKEIIQVLKDYDDMDGEKNKKSFARYVAQEYGRPYFQPATLRKWIGNREAIEISAHTMHSDRRSLAVPRESWGMYPEMEFKLAAHIRDLRSVGMVVETWMVDDEAKVLLHEKYPKGFPNPPDRDGNDEDTFGFKCRSVLPCNVCMWTYCS